MSKMSGQHVPYELWGGGDPKMHIGHKKVKSVKMLADNCS